MDRRDFFLKVAKASGVVIPSWGLLPLAAYGQQAIGGHEGRVAREHERQ